MALNFSFDTIPGSPPHLNELKAEPPRKEKLKAKPSRDERRAAGRSKKEALLALEQPFLEETDVVAKFVTKELAHYPRPLTDKRLVRFIQRLQLEPDAEARARGLNMIRAALVEPFAQSPNWDLFNEALEISSMLDDPTYTNAFLKQLEGLDQLAASKPKEYNPTGAIHKKDDFGGGVDPEALKAYRAAGSGALRLKPPNEWKGGDE